jgi:hypothetical protein
MVTTRIKLAIRGLGMIFIVSGLPQFSRLNGITSILKAFSFNVGPDIYVATEHKLNTKEDWNRATEFGSLLTRLIPIFLYQIRRALADYVRRCLRMSRRNEGLKTLLRMQFPK